MLILLLTLLLVAVVPLVGGDLRRLSTAGLRTSWVLPLAFALQMVFLGVLDDAPRAIVASAHGASYLLAAVFLWRNRHLRGLSVLAVGAACNALTIGLNGGTLPASRTALETAGRELKAEGFQNSGLLEDPLLPFMGDVFAVPAGIPFANVFSIGDVIILIGLWWVLHNTCIRLPEVQVRVNVLRTLSAAELNREIDWARHHLAQLRSRGDELRDHVAALRVEPSPPHQREPRAVKLSA